MPVTTIVPGEWTLKLGLTTADQDFTCEAGGFHLSSDQITSTVPPSFCTDGYTDVASVSHALTLDFQAFLDQMDALWYWLWENGGAMGKFEFKKGANEPTFAGDFRVVKPPIDAIAGQTVVGSVSMPAFNIVVTPPLTTLVASKEPVGAKA
jgi:hypothetical protein